MPGDHSAVAWLLLVVPLDIAAEATLLLSGGAAEAVRLIVVAKASQLIVKVLNKNKFINDS